MMNSQTEEKTLKLAMAGAFLLALWGIIMAGLSSSDAIMLDGMYNLVSGILSYFFIEITRLVSGKASKDFPLGYFAFESLLVFIKGATILLLVIMAVYSNLKILLSGGREPVLSLMSLYVAVAVLGCVVLYLISKSGYKKTGSELLQTETRAWLINAVISGAIGVALGITVLLRGTPFGWIERYIDQILVILMSLLFIKDPLVFMKNGLGELLLAAPREEYTKPLESSILALKTQLGMKALKLEILKTGRRLWLTVRLTPVKQTIDMRELARVKETIRDTAKRVYENTDTEIILETN
ncbi:cation transporter [Thermodesulfobacteriota bacterium]